MNSAKLKLATVLTMIIGIIGGAGWLSVGCNGRSEAAAAEEKTQKEVDPKPDDKKMSALAAHELSIQLVDAESALAEVDAALAALKYYQANADIETQAKSSVRVIAAATANLAKATADKVGKEWRALRQAKAALVKAQESIGHKQTDLIRIRALLEAKSVTQITLDRAKADLELGRAQLARAETILDVASDRLILDKDASTKQLLPSQSRILWLKSLPDDLIAAEANLADLEAANHAVDHWKTMRDIEVNAVQGDGSIVKYNSGLAKSIVDKAQAEGRAIRAARIAYDAANARLGIKKAQMTLLQQATKKNAESQNQIEKAKADLDRAAAQLARAETILESCTAARETTTQSSLKQSETERRAAKEVEVNLERLMKLRESGAATDTDIETARIAVAQARIAVEYRAIVEMRQNAYDRAKRLRETNAISAEELQKAADALEAAKIRSAERK